MATKVFDPIKTAREVEESYRDYIATTIHFDDVGLQKQLEDILATPRYLAKGPYLQAVSPYKRSKSVSELVSEGVLCGGMMSLANGNKEFFDPDRPLYTHQERAIRKSASGRNIAVVTGTGSGKTECFLLPIINDILSEFEATGPTPGVRAMILYPMNALANDQLKRLRELLAGTQITFGRYTGDTKEHEGEALRAWASENPGATKLPNELISREAIRKEPPNILLTNYSMLEYLLLRPSDAALFGKSFGSKWRHIAIDEAHVYSGALGTELAYLIRRLKARIESGTGTKPQLRCYATSATIGTKDEMPEVAAFASNLFGEPFHSDQDDIDVITSDQDPTRDMLPNSSWGTLSLDAWSELNAALDPVADSQAIVEVLSTSGVPSDVLSSFDEARPLRSLGTILLGEKTTRSIISSDEELIDLTDYAGLDRLHIDGLTADESGASILASIIDVLSSAQRPDSFPLYTSRYHAFLRAPEGLFINLATGKLSPNKKLEEINSEGQSVPVYEVSVCRHCGQAYILASENRDALHDVVWLDPSHPGTNSDDEFIPNVYYRLLESEEERDLDEDVEWLCPICGSIESSPDGTRHRFEHKDAKRLPIALNESDKPQPNELESYCRHCGYQSSNAIQPMRVSPESAGSVVCYDLVRDIPPFEAKEATPNAFSSFRRKNQAGSVICFSDRRQDAAYFAPSMDRTYGNITHRQLIREAVDALDTGSGCTPSAVINWIASKGSSRYPEAFDNDADQQAAAWMLDELAAEDSRNSLEGLGVIRVEPTLFLRELEDEQIAGVTESEVMKLHDEGITWISADDYRLLLRVCLESLRSKNTIEVPDGVAELRQNHETRANSVQLGGTNEKKEKDSVLFIESNRSTSANTRSMFIKKYALRTYGVDVTDEDRRLILTSLHEFLVGYLGGYFDAKHYLIGNPSSFTLNRDIWRLYRCSNNDPVYRCDTCGCEMHYDTKGICLTTKCQGTPIKSTFEQAKSKDQYYKEVYRNQALPIAIREHTAQLSTDEARRVQGDFLNGKVNVLSCTTTFELGVDVGDLRAIFMRNFPPTNANYTQRAGRVGRRAGKPGFAITFARLKPHDIAQFADPAKQILGTSRVPSCYLDNRTIAIRHVFATALSEFFRSEGEQGEAYAKLYNDFMALKNERPEGLVELTEYLSSKPAGILRQLQSIVDARLPLYKEMGIESWDWTKELVGEPSDSFLGGRLLLCHQLKHDDYSRLEDSFEQFRGIDDRKAGSIMHRIDSLKKERTIDALAESGVLPKYGFPTDLVELHLPEIEDSKGRSRLDLSRSLRQAICEYAPGNEIVADKKLWKSVGIRKPRNTELPVRLFAKCPTCETFISQIDNYTNEALCPVCGETVTLNEKMLVPSYGFEGKLEKKGVGLHRPRNQGFAQVYFNQHWPNEVVDSTTPFEGGAVKSRFASNATLTSLNRIKGGLRICSYCGAAISGENGKIPHKYWCEKSGANPHVTRYRALGSSFISDILEIQILPDQFMTQGNGQGPWESILWSLIVAGSELLEIPETELGGIFYPSSQGTSSIMLFDNVPGGAGHTKQLASMIPQLIGSAYHVVDGHCGCSGETCCYGCIASYYNQSRQAYLSRGAAKMVLGSLLRRSDS